MKEEPTILNAFDPIATVALATGHQPEREVRTVATKTKTNPIDDLPETNGTTLLAREVDESAGAFLARYERDYPSEYTDFIASDEGQRALGDAAIEDAQARREAKKAANAELAAAAARRKAEIEESHKPGPVTIVQAPTNGKPTKAAIAAGVVSPLRKGAKSRGAQAIATAVASGSPEPIFDGLKDGSLVAEGGKIVPAKPKSTTTPTDAPLTFGAPVKIGDAMYHSVLKRDGSPAAVQSSNWDWHCPKCGKRLRAATCEGSPESTHKATKAPAGYRLEDRLIK